MTDEKKECGVAHCRAGSCLAKCELSAGHAGAHTNGNHTWSVCGMRFLPLGGFARGCQGCGSTGDATWNGYCGPCADKALRCENAALHHGEPHLSGGTVWPSSPSEFSAPPPTHQPQHGVGNDEEVPAPRVDTVDGLREALRIVRLTRDEYVRKYREERERASYLEAAPVESDKRLTLGKASVLLEEENRKLREYAAKLERLVQASADDMRDAGEEDMAEAFERAIQPAPEGARRETWVRGALKHVLDAVEEGVDIDLDRVRGALQLLSDAKPPPPEAAPLGEFSDNSHEELVRVIATLRAKLARQVAANLALTTALDVARAERDEALKRAEIAEVTLARRIPVNIVEEVAAQRDEAVALLRDSRNLFYGCRSNSQDCTRHGVELDAFLSRLDAAKPKQEVP